jgi:hypothetical protein
MLMNLDHTVTICNTLSTCYHLAMPTIKGNLRRIFTPCNKSGTAKQKTGDWFAIHNSLIKCVLYNNSAQRQRL